MMDIQVAEIRKFTKMLAPTADFDTQFTFYYDETNNIKKFSVREKDFNCSFTSNFILGGLVHEGTAPNIQSLFEGLNLQKTVKEAKLNHIAKGDFLDCLTSNKLKFFLNYLLESQLYVHYSSLNILYWSLVDIVDSAMANSEVAQQLGMEFANHLKNDLYKLSRLKIDSVIDLFYKFKYPNIKQNSVIYFVEELTSLFHDYIDRPEYHVSLESLRQILKAATRKESLPFIMDEEDHILIKDLSQFYLRPVYLFKYSTHFFDNEDTIADTINSYRIMDGNCVLTNYSFIDSHSSQFIQASDILVGLIGKLSTYLNTSSRQKIKHDIAKFTDIQEANLDLLLDLIDKSHRKNIGFLHSTDSYEEMSKMEKIRQIRNKP
jgi:hypothetical protein